MNPQEKVELAELLEEKVFRSEQGIKFGRGKHIDTRGVEHNVLVVTLNLRPHRTVAEG